MFRQRIYNDTEDNDLYRRLEGIDDNFIFYNHIKFWDINHKGWVDSDSLTGYKIQKEIQVDNELIFYIYSEDYNAEDWK